jgi:hypothetical protein
LKDGIIIRGRFNKKGYDKTSGYRINDVPGAGITTTLSGYNQYPEKVQHSTLSGYNEYPERVEVVPGMGAPIPVNPVNHFESSIITPVITTVNPKKTFEVNTLLTVIPEKFEDELASMLKNIVQGSLSLTKAQREYSFTEIPLSTFKEYLSDSNKIQQDINYLIDSGYVIRNNYYDYNEGRCKGYKIAEEYVSPKVGITITNPRINAKIKDKIKEMRKKKEKNLELQQKQFFKTFKIKHDELGEAYQWEPQSVAGMLMCNRCNSMWVGLLLTIAYFVLPKPYTVALCAPLAISAIVMLIYLRKEGY